MKTSDIKKGSHILFCNIGSDYCDGEIHEIKKRKRLIEIRVSYLCYDGVREYLTTCYLDFQVDEDNNIIIPEHMCAYIGEERFNIAKQNIEHLKQQKSKAIKKYNSAINNFKCILNYE